MSKLKAAAGPDLPSYQITHLLIFLQDWKALFGEVEAAIAGNLDPASPQVRSLAERWTELLRGFTGGDPEIQQGLNKLYADQANWPKNFTRPL